MPPSLVLFYPCLAKEDPGNSTKGVAIVYNQYNHHEPLVLEASLHSLSFSASPELRTTFLISLSTRTPNLVPRGPLGLGTKLGTYFDKKRQKS